MSAKWTRRFVDLLIVFVAIAALALLVRSGNSMAEGKFHMVSYPAQSENITMYSLGQSETYWQVQEGTVRIDNHTWLRMVETIARLFGLGLLAAIFWQLRGTLSRIGTGDVFSEDNIRALRLTGWLLVMLSGLSVVLAIFMQSAILDAIPTLSDREINPSISWRTQGVENIWLEYSPPIIPLLLALIAFITAGAFRSGQQFREDSESVV